MTNVTGSIAGSTIILPITLASGVTYALSVGGINQESIGTFSDASGASYPVYVGQYGTATAGFFTPGVYSYFTFNGTICTILPGSPGIISPYLTVNSLSGGQLSPNFDNVTAQAETIYGNLVVDGTVTASPGVSGNEVINYNQITDGSLNPVFGSLTLTGSSALSGFVTANQLGNLSGMTTVMSTRTLPTSAYGQAIQVEDGASVTLPVENGGAGSILYFYAGGPSGYNIISNSTQFIYSPPLGLVTTSGPVKLSVYGGQSVLLASRGSGEFDVIGGSVLFSQNEAPAFVNPLTVPAAVNSNQAVNLEQLTNGSLTTAFSGVTAVDVTSTGTASLVNYQELQSSYTTSSTSGWVYAVNLESGTVKVITLNSSGSLVVSGMAPNGYACSVVLYLEQGSSGGASVTWPTGTMWSGGNTPTLSTAAGAIDVITLTTFNGGTTWFGFVAGTGMAT